MQQTFEKGMCGIRICKIKTPVKITDIPKIEKKFGITINIYGHNDGEIYPIKTNDNIVDESKHIDLLLTSQENEDSISKHNVWIKNFDKLNFRQTKHEHKKHICRNCLQGFSSKEVLEKHNPRCMVLNGAQAVDYPTKGSTLEFKSLKNSLSVPFVIYADLEAILQKLTETEKKKENESYTRKTHEHITCSHGYKVVCCENDEYSKPYKSYCGPDATYKFFEDLFEEEKEIHEHTIQLAKSKMTMTRDDWNNYNEAKIVIFAMKNLPETNIK